MRPFYKIPAWKKAPFLRLLFPVITGILIQDSLATPLIAILVLLGTCLVLYLALSFLRLNYRYRLRYFQGWLMQLIIIQLSMVNSFFHQPATHSSWYGNHICDSMTLLVRVQAPLQEKQRSYKAVLKVFAYTTNGNSVSLTGNIIAYFSKKENVAQLGYGDTLAFLKPLQSIRNAGNPGGFDYAAYSADQRLYHTIFLDSADYTLVSRNQAQDAGSYLYRLKGFILDVLKTYIKGKDVIGIAEALLIGYKADLDKELLAAYSNTGVVHIIAISGLHLGLIYVVLLWLLARIPILKQSRTIKVIIVLFALWSFSILTGAGASVLRSAVMFSCIMVGKNFFRTTSVYNSLAASAFILLAYNPAFIRDAGFQLSYLAVIGIIWMQPPIQKAIYTRSRVLNKLWEMCSITLAAQVMTFPACIYYFHQFPNFFIFSNLVAVPLSTLILFAEILLLLLSGFDGLATVFGACVGGAIRLMNTTIYFFDSLPFSIIKNIYASLFTTACLFMVVISIGQMVIYRSKSWLYSSLISLALFFTAHCIAELTMMNRRRLVVYNIPRSGAVHFIAGPSSHLYPDSIAQARSPIFQQYILPSLIYHKTGDNSKLKDLQLVQNKAWDFFGHIVMILDSSARFRPMSFKADVDILIISGNPRLDLAEVSQAIRPAMVIFDASNSLWKIAKWKKQCDELILRCHSIPEKGAFILDIH